MRDNVLVVENEEMVQNITANLLKRLNLQAIRAQSLISARDLFQSHRDKLLLILMDGSVESDDNPDTIVLVKEFRKTFSGPIIAISGNPETNKLLMQAGCSHYGNKPNIIKPIFNAIREAQQIK